MRKNLIMMVLKRNVFKAKFFEVILNPVSQDKRFI